MTLKDYQTLCVQSEPKHLTRGEEALLGLMGLNAAAGTALGMYHKTLFEGVELPQEGLLETLGEAIRHIAIVAHAADIELVEVLRQDAASLKLSNGSESTENGDYEKLEVKDVQKEETV